LSSTKPQDDFTNSEPTLCKPTFSIVDSDGNALNEAFVTLNENGDIQIEENAYPGGTVSLKVKAITEFGTPVFKTITVIEICGR
jgi:uncharacterized surface anchored protein